MEFINFSRWYSKTDPLIIGGEVTLFFAFMTWLISSITGNYSQVDRLWSITPIFYGIHWAIYPVIVHGEVISQRLLIMAILVVLWGLRLSYNFYRKGGYSYGGEDYRWVELQKIINNRFLFQIFNIFFISIYQLLLLYLICLPGYIALVNRTTPLNMIDWIAISSFLFFLIMETIADQQQWNFQSKKYQLINTKQSLHGEFAQGFISSGLFRYSRHPNFFCELMIWWCYYLFSVSPTFVTNSKTLMESISSSAWLNWSILGAVLLTLLFQGSSVFTESISAKKYPLYRKYSQATSKLIPWIPKEWKN